MAEYVANAVQNVALNSPILFNSSIPCNTGCVFHEDETGVFILRGKTNNCFARYQVTFNGNVAIPTGGAVTPIALAISVSGEPRLTSRAIYTPASEEGNSYRYDGGNRAYDNYGNSYGYDSMSMARGRGRNARRDSMGRYADGRMSGNKQELMQEIDEMKRRVEQMED